MARSRDSDDGMRAVTLSLGSAVYCVGFILQEGLPGGGNSRPPSVSAVEGEFCPIGLAWGTDLSQKQSL